MRYSGFISYDAIRRIYIVYNMINITPLQMKTTLCLVMSYCVGMCYKGIMESLLYSLRYIYKSIFSVLLNTLIIHRRYVTQHGHIWTDSTNVLVAFKIFLLWKSFSLLCGVRKFCRQIVKLENHTRWGALNPEKYNLFNFWS